MQFDLSDANSWSDMQPKTIYKRWITYRFDQGYDVKLKAYYAVHIVGSIF